MATYTQADYEVLRRRCVELKKAGWKQAAIAQALGLSPGWVSRTLKAYREQGPTALVWRKRTGAPTRLSTDQLAHLVTELNKGAEYHGFPGHIWTRPRINEVIKKLFGVSYDPSQVGRLLKRAGWSCQKPQLKARQQNLQRVEQWRSECLPELKSDRQSEKPKPKRVILYVDESAATADRLLPVAHVGS